MNIQKRMVYLNNVGSYSNALALIPNKSEFIEKYLGDRQSAGFLAYEIFTEQFLSSNVDFKFIN